MAGPSSQPLVSIITATYHRPHVLRYAILSAQRQTVVDWEMLVVGDACQDHTAEVVAEFAAADPRIRWLNLPVNHGEQSGPNNEGMKQARGTFFAFLNHDDLWFPDHLEIGLQHLKTLNADLVFTLLSAWIPNQPPSIYGASKHGDYDLATTAPASSWIFRREMVERVGLWRHASECSMVPSQDWLFRASRLGQTLKQVPVLTVIAISSGARRDSYRNNSDAEHQACWTQICENPQFREQELTRLLLPLAWQATGADLRVGKLFSRALKNVVLRVASWFGISPAWLRTWWNNPRGAILNRLRKVRGLPPLPKKPESGRS